MDAMDASAVAVVHRHGGRRGRPPWDNQSCLLTLRTLLWKSAAQDIPDPPSLCFEQYDAGNEAHGLGVGVGGEERLF